MSAHLLLRCLFVAEADSCAWGPGGAAVYLQVPPPLYREGILLLLLPDRPLSSLLLCLLLFLLHFPLHLLLLLLLLLLPAGSNSPGPS